MRNQQSTAHDRRWNNFADQLKPDARMHRCGGTVMHRLSAPPRGRPDETARRLRGRRDPMRNRCRGMVDDSPTNRRHGLSPESSRSQTTACESNKQSSTVYLEHAATKESAISSMGEMLGPLGEIRLALTYSKLFSA
jgi:hypothetical protein